MRSEFETPPNSKIRVVATVCEKLVEQIKDIHEAEVKVAEDNDREPPDWSNTVEMLLRKGMKAYKATFKP